MATKPKRSKVIRRGPPKDRKIALSTLRKSMGLTQDDLAQRANIAQAEISLAERLSDPLVSTIDRYARALGGELLLYVEINGRKYPITSR